MRPATKIPLIVFSKATAKLLPIFAKARLRDENKRLAGADVDVERGELKIKREFFSL